MAAIICRSAASQQAFLEYAFQEALALVEKYKSVILALAQALVDHPEHTLNADEIDVVIATALAKDTLAEEKSRRERWREIIANAASANL